MTAEADTSDGSAGALPADFYRRVLDQMPTPVVVVDQFGTIRYGNAFMAVTMGMTLDEARGRNIVEFIHPDDLGWALGAFQALSDAGRDESPWASEPWASVPMRVIDGRGQPIYVEVTGANSLHDELVDGFVYEIRHGAEPEMLRQVLTGLASGQPIGGLVQIVADMIAAPPVRLEVAVGEVHDGSVRLIATSGPRIATALRTLELDGAPWRSATELPVQLEVPDLDEPYRSALGSAGYADWCHVAVGDGDGGTAYLIAGLAPYHHVPATGILHRLARATELLGVIRIRATSDAMLEHRARHDPLTELPNRVGLAAALDGRTPPTGVLYVDLDGFKPVNDAHGHAAGDHVLRATAARLQRVVRPGDVVARVGGDEFVVVLPSLSDDRDDVAALIDSIADRIVREVSRPVEVNGVEIRVSASIGVAIATSAADVDAVVASADAAMYEAKRSGGSSHRIIELAPD